MKQINWPTSFSLPVLLLGAVRMILFRLQRDDRFYICTEGFTYVQKEKTIARRWDQIVCVTASFSDLIILPKNGEAIHLNRMWKNWADPVQREVSQHQESLLARASPVTELFTPSAEAPSSRSEDAGTKLVSDNREGEPVIWRVGDVILDQYKVTDSLGEGGMGTVHKVHHLEWNTDLAVKSPQPEIFSKEDGKENFIREAETWVKLGLHPHIVYCYYVHTLGGIPRVFAEYVEGGSLASWIRDRKLYVGGPKQALERMLDIAIQFAWGLHYAHEQKLIHMDIKPANVMMTIDGIAKVTDFGLAQVRALSETHFGQSVAVPGVGVMTPAYASPEQAQRKPLTRKTDIWSWGVSVLEMFVGKVIWGVGLLGPLVREELARHTAQDPAIPGMPTGVVILLARCFEQQPEKRPATMSEVASELIYIYKQVCGRPYWRQAPQPIRVRADHLNNQALSLLDLGKIKEAKQLWEQALLDTPYHLESTYNRGLVSWRLGEYTDTMVIEQIEDIRHNQEENWETLYLLAHTKLRSPVQFSNGALP